MLQTKKELTMFRPMILSRHPSHSILRVKNKLVAPTRYRSVVRLGSTTENKDIPNGGQRIEINTVQAIRNSSSKLLMKRLFAQAGVKTAEWTENINNVAQIHNNWEFAIVAKGHYGSKGRANTLIKSQAEFDAWKRNHEINHYIFERFMNYAHEFRLHITEEGCFYSCRKGLKKDAPEAEKWRRHDDICVWYLESNPEFFKPNSWNDIVADCVKGLKAVGADLLSFDVRVQSPNDSKGNRRQYQEYILLECNSASSMDNGTGNISVCAQKYIDELPKIINRKANGR